MLCEKCGTQLSETAEFCTNCGTKIGPERKKTLTKRMPDTEIQLSVRPSFKFGYMVLPSLIFDGLVLLLFCLPLCIMDGLGIVFSIIAFIITVLVLGIKIILNKKQYDGCCYDFYKTKVIYKDRFFNQSEKEVKYKYIKEVTMRQTFMQKYFNIGNIILSTDAENGQDNSICLLNIENVQSVYNSIKSMIGI